MLRASKPQFFHVFFWGVLWGGFCLASVTSVKTVEKKQLKLPCSTTEGRFGRSIGCMETLEGLSYLSSRSFIQESFVKFPHFYPRCAEWTGWFTYMKGEQWLHSRGSVGRYSLHGSFGYWFRSFSFGYDLRGFLMDSLSSSPATQIWPVFSGVLKAQRCQRTLAAACFHKNCRVSLHSGNLA